MLNPISLAFKKAKQENRAALLTYTVAGDSSKKQSLDILKSISKASFGNCIPVYVLSAWKKLPESKPNSPFFYYVKKPAGGEKAKVKLKAKKYNPSTRKHEVFVEKKLPPHSK